MSFITNHYSRNILVSINLVASNYKSDAVLHNPSINHYISLLANTSMPQSTSVGVTTTIAKRSTAEVRTVLNIRAAAAGSTYSSTHTGRTSVSSTKPD